MGGIQRMGKEQRTWRAEVKKRDGESRAEVKKRNGESRAEVKRNGELC